MSFEINIAGIGRYIPKNKILDTDIDKIGKFKLGSSMKINKVHTRYFASEEETSTKMAYFSLVEALKNAGLSFSEIDTLISTSAVPEQLMPTNSSLINKEFKVPSHSLNCFDINASCLGFLQAFILSASLLNNSMYKNIAISSSEIASKGLNWKDIKTCSLFGDGAASMILSKNSSNYSTSKIINYLFKTYSEGADYCKIEAGGTLYNYLTPPPYEDYYCFKMNGKNVFELSTKIIPSFINELFLGTNLSIKDIDLIIPHQASFIGIQYLKQIFEIDDSKIINILPNFGNQVSAALPMAFYEAIISNQLNKGKLALLFGTGAGLSMGGIILRY